MTRMMTVEVLGVDLVVEFDATPLIPAVINGPPEHCSPAEGGEVTVVAVLLDGTEIMNLLNDWVIHKCSEQIAERLAAEPAQIHEPCHGEDN